MAILPLRAVLWDFGGVILTSPFEAFRRYESATGLPQDFIRTINSTNPHSNAWALLERSDISTKEFDELFAQESSARGHRVPGADVLALLSGDIRPNMVAALDAVIAAGFKTACLTNNMVTTSDNMVTTNNDMVTTNNDMVSASESSNERASELTAVMNRFDVIVESSKVGVRKPEPRFYEIACEMLDVTPGECVFLDDLGINLKPAAAMGMRTIKVVDPVDAISQLAAITGIDF
ncbi:MAG: HAD-IA family hydrolase [Actinobacteria bacterium]|nr:HAD-IA family hydrolase [Actinomycetota bacterium]